MVFAEEGVYDDRQHHEKPGGAYMDQRTSYDKETCPVLTVCGTPDGNFSQERKKDSSAEGTLSVAPVAKENRPYDKGNLIEAAAETECLAAEPQIAAIKGKGVLKSTENSHGDDKNRQHGKRRIFYVNGILFYFF